MHRLGKASDQAHRSRRCRRIATFGSTPPGEHRRNGRAGPFCHRDERRLLRHRAPHPSWPAVLSDARSHSRTTALAAAILAAADENLLVIFPGRPRGQWHCAIHPDRRSPVRRPRSRRERCHRRRPIPPACRPAKRRRRVPPWCFPSSGPRCLPLVTSHSRTVRSRPPDNASLPSLLKATAVIGTLMPGPGSQLHAFGQGPEANRAIGSTGEQPFAVRRQRQTTHGVGVADETPYFLAAFRHPRCAPCDPVRPRRSGDCRRCGPRTGPRRCVPRRRAFPPVPGHPRAARRGPRRGRRRLRPERRPTPAPGP